MLCKFPARACDIVHSPFLTRGCSVEAFIDEATRKEIITKINIVNAFELFCSLPEHLRADHDIALRAVSCDGLILLHVPIRARDGEIVTAAIKNSAQAEVYAQGNLVYREKLDTKPKLRLVS